MGLLLLAQFTADDVTREVARLQRNYEFLSYGLIVAWLVILIYVLMMAGRQRKLNREIESLQAMLEDKPTSKRSDPRP